MQLVKVAACSKEDEYVQDLIHAVYPQASVSHVARVESDRRIIPDGAITLYYPIPMDMLHEILNTTFWPSNGNQFGHGVYLTTRLRAFNNVDKVAVIVCRAVVNRNNVVLGCPGIVLQPGVVAVDRFLNPQYVVFQHTNLIYPEYLAVFCPNA